MIANPSVPDDDSRLMPQWADGRTRFSRASHPVSCPPSYIATYLATYIHSYLAKYIHTYIRESFHRPARPIRM
jgi:hypothetical protein